MASDPVAGVGAAVEAFTGFSDDVAIAGHPLVAAAAELAADLKTDAVEADLQGVSRSRLDRLAKLGLHAVLGPAELGGVPVAVYRRVSELLAGSDGTTWFVWFQHNPVCRVLAASQNDGLRQRWLADMCAGRVQAGVAFSQLRRPGRVVEAQRVPGGWRLTGHVPWCTGFGLIDLVLVGAVTSGDPEEVVFGLVPLADGRGMRPSSMPNLAAMDGTHTVALELDGYELGDDEVVQSAERLRWASADASTNANVQPSTFGIAEASLSGLATRDPMTAASLAAPIAACRSEAYRIMDSDPPGVGDDRRRELRAEALLRTVDASAAYVAACGGSSLQSASEAQRLARLALFHLVFAQDRLVRGATMSALSERAAPSAVPIKGPFSGEERLDGLDHGLDGRPGIGTLRSP